MIQFNCTEYICNYTGECLDYNRCEICQKPCEEIDNSFIYLIDYIGTNKRNFSIIPELCKKYSTDCTNKKVPWKACAGCGLGGCPYNGSKTLDD